MRAAINGCDRDTRGGQRTLRSAAKDGRDRDAKQPNTAADGNTEGDQGDMERRDDIAPYRTRGLTGRQFVQRA